MNSNYSHTGMLAKAYNSLHDTVKVEIYIRGTLIFAYFAQIQKPAKIFAIFCMHILDT